MVFVRIIDKISEWTGTIAAWLVIPLMLVVMNEVWCRHLMNAPTSWGYDTCWMIFAAQFMIGGAFTLLRKGHIRIDIVYGSLSERNRLIYDIIIYAVIILPPMIFFTYGGVLYAADAFIHGENLSTTNWPFPSGPSKSLIPLGFFLMGLQCIADIIRMIIELKKGKQQ